MAITFMYAFVADLIGLSAIVGAFLAGSMFASTPLREEFEEGARFLGAVFTPIFFISMGLLVNLGESAKVPQFFAFALVLIAVAIVAKLAGCAIPARLTKMTVRESIAVGWGMTPRGEVGLIVALTALTAGIIEEGLFSVIVLVMIVVSILPTPFFKRAQITPNDLALAGVAEFDDLDRLTIFADNLVPHVLHVDPLFVDLETTIRPMPPLSWIPAM